MSKDISLKVTESIATIEKEISRPDPYILALEDSSRITFPDIYEMDAEDAIQFLVDFRGQANATDFDALERWLSPEDFKRYRAQRFSLRVHQTIMARVTRYYEEAVGTPGE